MKWKIVCDSGCDLRTFENIAPDTEFAYVPMKISVGDNEFVDTADLDTKNMMEVMYSYQGKTASACPSPDSYLQEFLTADYIFAVTISSGMSGSYNSAHAAMDMLLEDYPDKKVFILDTFSAGPGETLLVEKLNSYIAQGLDFETICEKIVVDKQRTGLFFALESLDNFVKNGRVSKVIGAIASVLNIHILGTPSEHGDIELLHKCRGAIRTNLAIIQELKKRAYTNGKLIITHVNNESGARDLENLIKKHFEQACIKIMPTSGLCSYYAERNGLLVGFEY